MFLAIDIGGTKTLLAAFSENGEIKNKVKFPTDTDYGVFLDNLAKAIKELGVDDFQAACIAVPGRIHRNSGTIIACGNLGWSNNPIERDVSKIINCPIVIENDANLAGLSEAILIKDEFKRVLYVTISTGIGTGIIINGVIDPSFIDSEGGQTILEHNGKFEKWESFASGSAIVRRYEKKASEITDEKTWQVLAHDFAVGFLALNVVIQPDAIVIGGGVGTHFEHYGDFLVAELKRFETPLIQAPPIFEAKRPEEAVIYGCYELIKQKWPHAWSRIEG